MKANYGGRISIVVGVFILLIVGCPNIVSATYIISATSNGMPTITVEPGGSIDLDISLSSDSSDVHDSAIFQITFSKPGLNFNSYSWSSPYLNGTDDDDSKPRYNLLPLTIDFNTLSGPGYPAGVVDIEQSNTADNDFTIGLLTTLNFTVPNSWSTIPDSIIIDVIPDTFANGFNVVPTTVGPSFTVNIVPEPSMLGLIALGSLYIWRRKN